jgi:hypothetical protein
MYQITRVFVLLLALAPGAGCRLVEARPQGRSPLAPLMASSDAISLEVFSAPSPLDDPQVEELWKQVDEQTLSPDLRTRLAQNGIRAGVVGPNVPDALAALLKVTDEHITPEERTLVPLQANEGIRLTVMQPRAGERRDLVASQTYDQMPLLQRVGSQVEGKTYYKAEGRLALRVSKELDGRARLELTPELHHGEFKNRVTGDDGMMTWKQERQKLLFDELKLSATLAPGQMLVVSCRSDRPGSIGHYFFTQSGGEQTMQKFFVLRIAQAAADRSFHEEHVANTSAVSSDAAP